MFSCGIDDFVEPNILAPVFNIQVYPNNNSLTIQFDFVNSEEKFDGFNIYISKSSSIASSSIIPLKNNGILPSISHSPVQSQQTLQYSLTFYNDSETIQNGTTYFIAIKSHDYDNYESPFSKEVHTTPRPEGISILNINESFNLSTGSISAIGNFTLTTQNNILYLFSDYDLWKDEGYYENQMSFNTVVDSGFIASKTYIPLIANHIYSCKTTNSHFAKIYISNIENNSISFFWAYQTTQNIHDI